MESNEQSDLSERGDGKRGRLGCKRAVWNHYILFRDAGAGWEGICNWDRVGSRIRRQQCIVTSMALHGDEYIGWLSGLKKGVLYSIMPSVSLVVCT
jgi:hypothetical protein